VRKAECRNPKDTEQILGELEREVGLTECNKAVLGCCGGRWRGRGGRRWSGWRRQRAFPCPVVGGLENSFSQTQHNCNKARCSAASASRPSSLQTGPPRLCPDVVSRRISALARWRVRAGRRHARRHAGDGCGALSVHSLLEEAACAGRLDGWRCRFRSARHLDHDHRARRRSPLCAGRALLALAPLPAPGAAPSRRASPSTRDSKPGPQRSNCSREDASAGTRPPAAPPKSVALRFALGGQRAATPPVYCPRRAARSDAARLARRRCARRS